MKAQKSEKSIFKMKLITWQMKLITGLSLEYLLPFQHSFTKLIQF